MLSPATESAPFVALWGVADEMSVFAQAGRDSGEPVDLLGLASVCAIATSPEKSPEERRQAAIILGALAIRIAAGDNISGA